MSGWLTGGVWHQITSAFSRARPHITAGTFVLLDALLVIAGLLLIAYAVDYWSRPAALLVLGVELLILGTLPLKRR